MITRKDLQWFTDLVDTLEWTFAKSMKDAPHSYVVRDKQLAKEDFERAVRVIRTYGDPGKFWSKTHIYLHVNGKKYWTMGYPVWQTKIINVADAEHSYGTQDAPDTRTGHEDGWNGMATTYDEVYELAEETAAVRSAVIPMMGAYAPTVLDVGCGTGRALDMGITSNALYTGVDSSQAMLNELVRKVNLTRKKMPTLIAGRAEDVEFAPAYDLGLALMGTPDLLDPSVIDRMEACCTSLVLMPKIGGRNDELCRSLDGAVVRSVGQYRLVTVGG